MALSSGLREGVTQGGAPWACLLPPHCHLGAPGPGLTVPKGAIGRKTARTRSPCAHCPRQRSQRSY